MSGELTPMFGLLWERPWLLLLALLPLLHLARSGRQRSLHLGTSAAFRSLGRGLGLSRVLHGLGRLCLVSAFVITALALAGPRAEKKSAELRSGIDVIIALDLSTSMNALDLAGDDVLSRSMTLSEARMRTRIAAARRVVEEFIKRRPRDRIGLVVFAGDAFPQVPPTFDHEYLREVLRLMRPGMLPDGTAIGNALLAGVARLENSEANSKVLVLVTDGDNTAGNVTPEDAADAAAEQGVRVDTVLIGEGQGLVPVLADQDGQMARIGQAALPANPELLRTIAKLTGGQAYQASDEKQLRQRFHAILDELQRSELNDQAAWSRSRDLSASLLPFIGLSMLLGMALRAAAPVRV
ncbi:MAG: VWA domain-containing protein [Myxococcota bacterium]|nr:VWA domain-containing protein [Myxococcota bacterium]